jgi:hypothetical protein
MKRLWRITLVTFLVIAMLTSVFSSESNVKAATNEKVYVGVTFGGTTVDEAKQLIDKVYSYTNLFIMDSWTISGAFNDSNPLTEICDYAIQHNLSVIVYFSFIYYNYTRTVGNLYNSSVWDLYGVSPWHADWLNQAKARWGDMFLGAYLYDEPGGKQVDMGYWGGNMTTFTGGKITSFVNTTSYSDAGRRFTRGISTSGSMQHIINSSISNSVTTPLPVFTADYALYWFDYKAGYSTVLAELGNNSPKNTKTQQIALCRGAATAQNKDWGAIVTLAVNTPPVAENSSTVLSDMTMAYEAGAKYILVFNYELDGHGIFTDEHFNAIKQFWENIHSSKADSWNKSPGTVALVLPADYGWGMRRENDRMWGLWDADNNSAQIWSNLNKLTDKYGLNLDIVYDDPAVSIQGLYSKTYFWNDTINSALALPLPNGVYVLVSVAGSIGAVVCVSTYWVTKRKKPKTNLPLMQEPTPNKETILEPPTATSEKVKGNTELNKIFASYANIMDPLFDLLIDLQGHTNWITLENDLTRCKLAKALEGRLSTPSLDFRNLSQFIKEKKAKEAVNEMATLIHLLHGDISTMDKKEISGELQLDYVTLKSVVLAYFTLNDVLLGQAIADDELEKEKTVLAKVLEDFSNEAETDLSSQFTDRLKLQKTSELPVEVSRALVRKLLGEFLAQA